MYQNPFTVKRRTSKSAPRKHRACRRPTLNPEPASLPSLFSPPPPPWVTGVSPVLSATLGVSPLLCWVGASSPPWLPRGPTPSVSPLPASPASSPRWGFWNQTSHHISSMKAVFELKTTPPHVEHRPRARTAGGCCFLGSFTCTLGAWPGTR